jgi:hypothetical protein
MFAVWCFKTNGLPYTDLKYTKARRRDDLTGASMAMTYRSCCTACWISFPLRYRELVLKIL